jgi:hypothetical protein
VAGLSPRRSPIGSPFWGRQARRLDRESSRTSCELPERRRSLPERRKNAEIRVGRRTPSDPATLAVDEAHSRSEDLAEIEAREIGEPVREASRPSGKLHAPSGKLHASSGRSTACPGRR